MLFAIGCVRSGAVACAYLNYGNFTDLGLLACMYVSTVLKVSILWSSLMYTHMHTQHTEHMRVHTHTCTHSTQNICVCMHTQHTEHMRVHTHTCTHSTQNTCVCTHTHAHTAHRTHACAHTHMHTHAHRTHACAYMHTEHMRMHTHMHTEHMHMHTHKCT